MKDNYSYKGILYWFLMNLEKEAGHEKRVTEIGGIISQISELQPCSLARTSLQATSVRYKPVINTNEGNSCREFTFYKALPENLEECRFAFIEVPSGQDREEIPRRQVLYVYNDGKPRREFIFER